MWLSQLEADSDSDAKTTPGKNNDYRAKKRCSRLYHVGFNLHILLFIKFELRKDSRCFVFGMTTTVG